MLLYHSKLHSLKYEQRLEASHKQTNDYTPRSCWFGLDSSSYAPSVGSQWPYSLQIGYRTLHTSTLKMEAACPSETSVTAYRTTRYYNPE
jgi:hypothetical protein